MVRRAELSLAKWRITVFVLTVAILSSPQVTSADPPPTAALNHVERLERNRAYLATEPNPDSNGDGRISSQEWLDQQWRFLVSYDTDGDQRLSMAEYVAVFCISANGPDRMCALCKASKERDFGPAGKDRAFLITRDAYAPVARRMFTRNDKNGDGYLIPGGEGH
jgi:hypothetical protein